MAHQNAGRCKSVKLISCIRMMEYRWEARNKEENSIFIVQGWGFSPALFVALYNPQFLSVGHYLLIEDNREMRE